MATQDPVKTDKDKPDRPDRRKPGRVLSDKLADMRLTHVQAVQSVNGVMSASKLSGVVRGEAPITERTAVVLEKITGIPAEEWLDRAQALTLPVIRASVEAEIKAKAAQYAENVASSKKRE